MSTKPFFQILSLTTILALAACSTGLHIFDSGYSAIDVGEGRWAVKFDSTEVRSTAEAEANLMVHTARWAIDHNATHFSVYELVIGNETKFRTDADTCDQPRGDLDGERHGHLDHRRDEELAPDHHARRALHGSREHQALEGLSGKDRRRALRREQGARQVPRTARQDDDLQDHRAGTLDELAPRDGAVNRG